MIINLYKFDLPIVQKRLASTPAKQATFDELMTAVVNERKRWKLQIELYQQEHKRVFTLNDSDASQLFTFSDAPGEPLIEAHKTLETLMKKMVAKKVMTHRQTISVEGFVDYIGDEKVRYGVVLVGKSREPSGVLVLSEGTVRELLLSVLDTPSYSEEGDIRRLTLLLEKAKLL